MKLSQVASISIGSLMQIAVANAEWAVTLWSDDNCTVNSPSPIFVDAPADSATCPFSAPSCVAFKDNHWVNVFNRAHGDDTTAVVEAYLTDDCSGAMAFRYQNTENTCFNVNLGRNVQSLLLYTARGCPA